MRLAVVTNSKIISDLCSASNVNTTDREDGQTDVNFMKSSFIPGAKVSHFACEDIDEELQTINLNELMLL